MNGQLELKTLHFPKGFYTMRNRNHVIRINRLCKYDFVLFLVLITFLPPQIFNFTIPRFRFLIYFFRLLTVLLFFSISKLSKPQKTRLDIHLFIVMVINYAFAQSVIVLLKKFSLTAFGYPIFHVAYLFILYTTLERKPKLLVKNALVIFGVYNIVQILSIIKFYPRGMLSSRSVIAAEAVYFFGGKNQIFIPMLIFLLALCIENIVEHGNIRKGTFFIIAAFALESILIDSMSAFACIALFGAVCLLLFTKAHKYLVYVFNPYLLFALLCVIFVMFCIINSYSAFSENSYLAEFAHKYGRNLSFTGRTVIWQQAINMFIENPAIGGTGIFYIPGRTVDQAHNAFLDVISKYGLVGFIPYILITISVMRMLKKLKSKNNLYILCSASFFIVLFHCLFEFMDYYLLLFIFFVIFAANEISLQYTDIDTPYIKRG